MKRESPSGVQSVVRALSLLNVLAESQADCSFSEITKQSKLPSSTVHRLLNSLVQAGYVSQNPETARYGLGANLILLGQKAVQNNDLIYVARPWLEELALRTGETINLTARIEDSVIQLDHVDSRNMLRVSYPAGERFPMHASASGKLFLAYMSAAERHRVLADTLDAFTQATLISPADLEAEVRIVQRQGYAIDDAERELGVRCVAAPIRSGRDEVVAAISISGPSMRLTVEQLHEMAISLVETADIITRTWRHPRLHATNGQ